MGNLIFIENENSQFVAKIIKKDERYGLNKCIIHDKEEPLIEFYDVEYAGCKGFNEIGQFIGRYYLKTIMEINNSGLSIDMSIPKWTISRDNIAKIQKWVKQNNLLVIRS